MTTIPLTVAETQRAGLAPENLKQAVRALREYGYVILENAVDRQHCCATTSR
jgi:hypothetical protein